MTGTAFAKLLHARRTGRGKWIAKCPSHPDRKPSLSIAEGKRGVLIRCMSNGCDTRDILGALGLTYSDLFYDRMTAQVRARTSLQDQRESLERELGLAIWLRLTDLEKKLRKEIQLIRCRIEPLVVYREWKSHRWNCMNRTQREKSLEQAYERFSNSQNKPQ